MDIGIGMGICIIGMGIGCTSRLDRSSQSAACSRDCGFDGVGMDIGIGMGICIIGMGIGCGVGSVRSGAANGACDFGGVFAGVVFMPLRPARRELSSFSGLRSPRWERP